MKLTQVSTYPKATGLLKSPIGTTYVYRRFLIFAKEPVWIVATKVEDDRWIHAQAIASVKAALSVMSAEGTEGGDGKTCVIADCDSKTTAKRLIAKEIEADRGEDHVGLFVGQLAPDEVPKQAPIDRPDAKAIAAARRLAATSNGAKALAAELRRFEPGKGASPKQLAALGEAFDEVPPDLQQLLRWSNGHEELGLMSIDAMIEVNGDLDRDGLFVLNDNENGDYWGIVTKGPLKGALFYDDYGLNDDPPAHAIKASSILDWLKQAVRSDAD